MANVAQLPSRMQRLLVDVAQAAGRSSKFVKRNSKLSAPKWVQALTLGWLANPEATLEELSQAALTVGVKVTPQGIHDRFSSESAECFKQVLGAAVEQAVSADGVAVPILARFSGVYLADSTTIALPEALHELLPGCGNQAGTSTALKLGVLFNVADGALALLEPVPAREHDRSLQVGRQQLPEEALWLADLGFFDLARLAQMDREGVYWLTQVQAGTVLYDEQGERLELVELLKARCKRKRKLDMPVLLGAEARIGCRLLAQRVPKEVAQERRRRLRAEAKRRGQGVSATRLALAEWTVLVTNVGEAKLTVAEALVLVRVRWQIELLFKLWKSHGKIDESRSHKPYRVLTEVYAKLLGMLLQHWLLVTSLWQYPDRSLTKAAKVVRARALMLAHALGSPQQLTEVIEEIQRCLTSGCRINKRRKQPHTYQLLLQLPTSPFA